MKAEALRRCGGWMDPIPQLLRDTHPGDVTGYPVLDLPPPEVPPGEAYLPGGADDPCGDGDGGCGSGSGSSSASSISSRGSVVLIGDAIHPMSPFKV